MKLFGKTAKIVKVKDFEKYVVEVTSYFFGKKIVKYQRLRYHTYWSCCRGDILYKDNCIGTYQEALQIYNEYFNDFEEVEKLRGKLLGDNSDDT